MIEEGVQGANICLEMESALVAPADDRTRGMAGTLGGVVNGFLTGERRCKQLTAWPSSKLSSVIFAGVSSDKQRRSQWTAVCLGSRKDLGENRCIYVLSGSCYFFLRLTT